MRIVIADDSLLLREGLQLLLTEAGHEVVAAVGDGPSFVEAVLTQRPDVALVDVRMPPSHSDEGLRAAVSVRAEWPEAKVMVLSQYVEERYASELITAHGGAIGYLLKDRVADVSDFLEAVARIRDGATVLDPEVVAQLLSRRPRDERMQRLTPREASTLALIAEGRSNQAIAATLFVSEASVEKYITAIFQKLELEPDESGNRRVLAALVHLEHGGPQPQTGAGS